MCMNSNYASGVEGLGLHVSSICESGLVTSTPNRIVYLEKDLSRLGQLRTFGSKNLQKRGCPLLKVPVHI